MKKSVNTMITAIVAFLLCSQASGQGDWHRETETALKKVTEESLYREISFLSDTLCKGRATGTAGNMEAAFWIARKFRKAGLHCFSGSYSNSFITPAGANAHNVLGMLPGALTMPKDRYVIIGAHFDHLGELDGRTYPGADANASGTVALTALADIFGQMKRMGKVYDSNIIFVAFDAKEMGMAGSYALWKLIDYGMIKDPLTGQTVCKEQISLMINIDQIGSTLSPVSKERKDYLLMLGNSSLPKERQIEIEACNMLHGSALDLCLSYYGSRTFTDVFYRLSDQKVFVENGIPAVLFTSGITLNTNKTRDTVASLDMEVLLKRIRLIWHWTERML